MKKIAILALTAAGVINRHRRVAAALSLGVLLAACDPATQAAQIAKVQQEAQLACSFVPAASTIAKLLSVFVPQVGSVVDITTQVADGICGQVNALKSSRRGAAAGSSVTVYVQGVKITGTLK